MNQLKLGVLFLMIVFCSCCIAQNKGESTSYGPTTSVRIIKQDRNGNIWLASNEGIIRYDGKSFTNITGEVGSNRFFSVLEDSKGNFWFGNNGTGAYYYDSVKKSLQHFTTEDGLISNQVMCMYEDRIGTVWFGTRGGVSSYNPRRSLGQPFQNLTTEGGFSNNGVTTIIEDKTGRIWFGTRDNTYTYDGKKTTVFTSKDNKTFSDVWSIIED
ncbi:MAG TPA: histidine kinase, partial [Runella sp.]|nr:histidine kinase [Runella sp.]